MPLYYRSVISLESKAANRYTAQNGARKDGVVVPTYDAKQNVGVPPKQLAGPRLRPGASPTTSRAAPTRCFCLGGSDVAYVAQPRPVF